MPKYTTIANIEKIFLTTTFEATATSQIEIWIDQIEKFIDVYTGRNFVAEEKTRLFDGIDEGRVFPSGNVSRKVLLVGDFVATTTADITLTIGDDDALIDDEFLFYPANTEPKTTIVLKDSNGEVFDAGQQNIEVVAEWGYSRTVPDDIIFATNVLVAGLIKGYWTKERLARSKTLGRYSVTFTDEKYQGDYERAMSILDSYRLITI